MNDSHRCTAHLSDGSGQRCKKAAISGGTVCATHGGRAPQVQKAARLRLLEAADTAAARLVKSLDSPDERIGIKAAQMILDRAGLGPIPPVGLAEEEAEPTEDPRNAWIKFATLEERTEVLRIVETAFQRSQESGTGERDADSEDKGRSPSVGVKSPVNA